MKSTLVITILAVALLGGCTPFTEADRHKLDEAYAKARAAKNQAEQADYEARKAREEANEAQERADRMFQEMQQK